MKQVLFLLSLAFLFLLPQNSIAQRRKKTPEQEATVTPDQAKDKSKENANRKEAEYQSKKERHEAIQDKATRKRMKESRKKSQQTAHPSRLPWYKRLFR
jgi:hypothetical protein